MALLLSRIVEVKGLPLNAIGDFLAGFFSPVAFMWLVVGYFQQGEELKLNTRALELQVHELRLSVEQQRELVEVTKADLTLSKEAYEREREESIRQAQPVFHFQTQGYSSGPSGITSLEAAITNNGHTATKIRFECDIGSVSPNNIVVLGVEERRSLRFDFSAFPMVENKLRLQYVDGLGSLHHQVVSMVKDTSGMFNFMPPEAVFLTDV